MKKSICKLEQLTDSSLLYMQNIPDFALYILTVVAIAICSLIVWSMNASKVMIIKAQGIVESVNKNYVMPPFSGEIIENDMYEGMVVEEGDTLFTIKSVDFDLQKDQLVGEKEEYERKIEQQKKLEDSIKSDTNLFSSKNEYDSLYYNQYEAYKSKIEQNQINLSMMEAYGYTDEQIENEIVRNQNLISEIYYSTLMEIEESILNYQTQVNSIELKLKAIEDGLTEYVVTANESGVLHLLSEYKAGMVVQASTTIASIASETDEFIVKANISPTDFSRIEVTSEVEIEIEGLIKAVYGTIGGSIYQIDSDISVIQGNDGKRNSYFSVYIHPNSYYVVNREGKKVNLTNGMVATVNIHYDEVTYMEYFLECLGVKKQ